MLQKMPGITRALWISGWMLAAMHTSMTSASKPKRFNGTECVEWFVSLKRRESTGEGGGGVLTKGRNVTRQIINLSKNPRFFPFTLLS
jgi:hypothetical protein